MAGGAVAPDGTLFRGHRGRAGILLTIAIWLAFAPLAVGAVQPKRAEAQAGPLIMAALSGAGAAGAACIAATPCIVAVAAVLSLAVYAGTPTGQAQMESFAAGVAYWYDGLGAADKTALASRVNNGSIAVSPELAAQWEVALSSVTWPTYVSTRTTNWPVGAPFQTHVLYDDSAGGSGIGGAAINPFFVAWLHVSQPALNAAGACTGTTNITWSTYVDTLGSSPSSHIDVGSSYLDAAALYSLAGSHGLAAGGNTFTSTITSGADANRFNALCAGNGWLRLTMQGNPEPYAGNYYKDKLSAGQVTVTANAGTGNSVAYSYGATGYVVTTPSAADYAPDFLHVAPGTVRTVRAPANLDDLIGKSGNPVLPLADGTAGAVVGPVTAGGTTPTASLTDVSNAPWWQGLFNGVSNAVVALGAGILALPASMVSAVQAKVIPTVSVATLTTGVVATVLSVAPACFVGGGVTAVDALYTGATAGAITIPLATIGGEAIELVLEDSTAAALARVMTRVALLVLLVLYGFQTFRRIFGGS